MQENKDFALTWRVKEYGNNMGATFKYYEDVDSWKTIMFLYTSALKEVGTKLEILNDEFQHVHQYNPIDRYRRRPGRRDKTYRGRGCVAAADAGAGRKQWNGECFSVIGLG